ncbi:pseudouridine synthase [Sediminibacterium goheungense]|uniref:Pseudouridine synthase n=1 Tax=Sediminibacterium goheungense TaxID=1086393 RepID=A0A4R6IVY9_9BACT|nr:pseudouridine synthase [Sediminibacterium goheungense]TDO26832.1 pseudouridine synthase [Sediminibacterium goheungense]
MKKRTDNFDKFASKKKGSAIKEAFRQEKKKIKAEARAAGEEMRKKKIEKIRGEQEKATSFRPQTTGKGKATGFESRATSQKAGKKYPDTKSKNSAKDAIAPNIPVQGNGSDEQMPLNKFIAHAGVCGRREAAELVKEGKVTVNGDKVFEPGYKVSGKDKVIVKGKQVFLQRNAVYILLNKPKDYITTANDPQGRKTVLDLIKNATPERVYPVGRLDRNTTGVLILTNDGELAQKLTHPSFEVKKIYEVTLDKPVIKKDLEAIVSGITLEDGFIQADSVGYADDKQKNIVGIEIHSGRNRIVRRIFEHLGYDVKGLDRVMFANLTKKNVDRGKWRFLNEKEVRLLKFMNKSFVRKAK